MRKAFLFAGFIFVLSLTFSFVFTSTAEASHSWGNYHWARTANPFTIKLGDNLATAWDAILSTSSVDWTKSSVLDTSVVTGLSNPKNCKAVLGRVEVCNSKYGNNGWLGIAQIWLTSGSHIAQGVVKVNDTYFNTAKYNTTAWKNLVMCQEVGHTFGLDHQDENFSNTNLGTCMDYASDPETNQHPNAHDYSMLESIYSHLDSFTSVSMTATAKNIGNEIAGLRSDWGKAIGQDGQGRDNEFERDLGNGNKVLTHVFWAE
jgi:hypothetical protein